MHQGAKRYYGVTILVDQQIRNLVDGDEPGDRVGIGINVAVAFHWRYLEPLTASLPEDFARMPGDDGAGPSGMSGYPFAC